MNVDKLSALRGLLERLATEHLGAADAARFCELARPAIRLSHGPAPSSTRLGGNAMLDPSEPWPEVNGRPLALLVVLDLEDVASFTVDVGLPVEGYLSFFYDAEEQSVWGFEPDDRWGWRVMYVAQDLAVEVEPPAGAPRFAPVWLALEQVLTLPGWEEAAAEPFFPPHAPRRSGPFGNRSDASDQRRRDAFHALQAAWDGDDDDGSSNRHRHQVGGWPMLEQAPIWRECDLVSQGHPLGTLERWRAAESVAIPDALTDWRLLLQVDSDDAAGWMWGDVGALYYAVRSTAPLSSRFEQAWMVLQCG